MQGLGPHFSPTESESAFNQDPKISQKCLPGPYVLFLIYQISTHLTALGRLFNMQHGMSGSLVSGTEILECSPNQCFLAFLGLYISLNKTQVPHFNPCSLDGDNSILASNGKNMARPEMIYIFHS